MADTKHTPGPWRVETGYPSVSSRQAPDLALCNDQAIPMSERLANARLIAAAPCLLAALQAVVAWMDAPDESAFSDEQLAQARAAIAKATGEPHV